MTTEQATNERYQEVSKECRYQPPRLICYGQVRDLTRNGTASTNTENFVSATMCSQNNAMACIPSDRIVKQNIVHVGAHPLGIGLYLFDYIPEYREAWGHGRQFGVMADEVEQVMPEAVSVHQDGYKMVNYGLLGVTRTLQ